MLQEPAGVVGGYLVTNAWGRPMEFRLSTAVQPTRVQQILYGPTLEEYLHAELIGKTLVEKTSTLPGLIVTDRIPTLALRARISVPVLALAEESEPGPLDELIEVRHARSSQALWILAKFQDDLELIRERLDQLDPAIDITEPFARVREAVAEARKLGVTHRAA